MQTAVFYVTRKLGGSKGPPFSIAVNPPGQSLPEGSLYWSRELADAQEWVLNETSAQGGIVADKKTSSRSDP